jgi:hypothetical protein
VKIILYYIVAGVIIGEMVLGVLFYTGFAKTNDVGFFSLGTGLSCALIAGLIGYIARNK